MSRHAFASFIVAAAATLACIPQSSRGDDTDIYIDNTRLIPSTSLPMVMFSVDYRANLGSTICSDATNTTSCPQASFFIENGLTAAQYSTGGAMSFFDLLRASLRIVLRESKGFKAGLMLNHNNTALAARNFTVVNTAACSAPQVAIQSAAVREGDRGTNSIEFTVTLSAGCEGSTITVDYRTSTGTEDTATEGSTNDYTAASGTLTFDNRNINPKRPVYDTTKTIVVPINPDLAAESDETFSVTLSNITVANIAGATVTASLNPDYSVATGFIEDDDGAQADCSGPLVGSQVCSNGAYIARYLGPESAITETVGIGQTDHDRARIELLAILDGLPPTGGNISQPYQGKEMFFELYRYLTGQDTYNSSNGYFDYNTDSTLNLARRSSTFSDPNIAFSDATGGSGGDNLVVGRDNRAASTRTSDNKRVYVSPLATADACTKIFTINFLFGVSNQENESDAAINDSLAQGGLDPTTDIPGDNTGFSKVLSFLHGIDLADGRHGVVPDLAGTQNVTSFFVSLPTPENSDPPAFDLVTQGYAQAGGTSAPLPLAKDPRALVAAIRNALEQILSVSTTFVSAAVPVNVFNRAEIVNNLYFSVFQAEAGANWTGNLKKLKLGSQTVSGVTSPIIVDSPSGRNGDAIADDGRIENDALTFWTDTSGTLLNEGDTNGDGTVDNFNPPDSNTAANPTDYVTKRDGKHIARGGSGHRIPGFASSTSGPGTTNPSGTPTSSTARKVFYLKFDSASASLDALDSTISTAEQPLVKTQLGDVNMSAADMDKLVNFTRGLDVNDADSDRSSTDARYWIMGDSLHARPLPINYGYCCGYAANTDPAVENATAIFIILASNDGHIRMIRNTGDGPAATAAELGEEVWTFVPPEGMQIQQQLLRETATTVPFHPFAADGEPAALVLDQNGNGSIECDGACDASANDDRVLLYFGLRRGGKAYYAMDITDPYAPKFLWRIAPDSRLTTAGYQTTTDFAQLGQTFSRPRIGTVLLGSASGAARRRLAVFFGGGYHGGYTGAIGSDGKPVRIGNDIDGAIANDTSGNAIFVVRADTGTLIWKAIQGSGTETSTVFQHPDLLDSIPSNLTIADTDADGAIDRIVVGDNGGNIWRADLGPNIDDVATTPDPTQAQTTDDWTLRRVACLGRHGGTNCADITGTSDPTLPRKNDRRFFHEPDLVQGRDAIGRFDALILGSGDREDPLDQGGATVENFFYVIKDRNVGIGATTTDDATTTDNESLIDQSELGDVTDQCVAGEVCTVNLEDGWKMQLDHTPASEKVLSAAVTVANNIFFTTYLPPPARPPTGSCGPQEGGGFLYAISLTDASPVNNYDNDSTTDEKEDRSIGLDTPGIPAQVVFLGSSADLTNSGPSGGCTLNLLAGAQIFEAPGCPRYRTFWQRLGN